MAIQESSIIGIIWALSTLEGQQLPSSASGEKTIHFRLLDDGKITGFTGCNTFNGAYRLKNANHIRFAQMLTTMRACPDIAVDEPMFLKVFESADSYIIEGDTLILKDGEQNTSAVFEAVYF